MRDLKAFIQPRGSHLCKISIILKTSNEPDRWQITNSSKLIQRVIKLDSVCQLSGIHAILMGWSWFCNGQGFTAMVMTRMITLIQKIESFSLPSSYFLCFFRACMLRGATALSLLPPPPPPPPPSFVLRNIFRNSCQMRGDFELWSRTNKE